jgi:hypothetical protein
MYGEDLAALERVVPAAAHPSPVPFDAARVAAVGSTPR